MLLHGDETRPHPAAATTTPTARTTSITWVDWDARRRARCSEFTRQRDRAARPSTRCSGGAGSSTGRPVPPAAAATRCRTSPGSPRTAEEMTERGLGAPASARAVAVFLNGEGIPERGQPRRAASSTTRSCCCFNAHDERDRVHPARRRVRRRSGRSCVDTGRARELGPSRRRSSSARRRCVPVAGPLARACCERTELSVTADRRPLDLPASRSAPTSTCDATAELRRLPAPSSASARSTPRRC